MAKLINDENLLIDLDNSASNSPPIISANTFKALSNDIQTKCERSQRNSDSMAMLCSSTPIYKLLNAERCASIDSADNNPFDKMDKQAGLLDDPFEIVENAALATPKAQPKFTVETGTLISIDSPTYEAAESSQTQSYRQEVYATPSKVNLFNASLISTAGLFPNKFADLVATACIDLDSCLVSPIDAGATLVNKIKAKDQSKLHINETRNDSVQTVSSNTSQTQPPNDFVTESSCGVQTQSRSIAKLKNNSLNLLKYSLSNSRMDSPQDNGSPILSGDENSPGDGQTLHQKQLMMSKSIMRRNSGTDDSFDDLSATKPNWIDSETDIDMDIDSDLARLSFPMLNKSLSDLNAESVNDTKEEEKDPNLKLDQNATVSRDKLLEKLASIKLKNPSPPSMAEPNENNNDKNKPQVDKLDYEEKIMKNEPLSPKTPNHIIRPQNQLASENPYSLIENLRKIVDQCDDKTKQTEATNLLESLSSILTFHNNKIKNPGRKVKYDEETPPKPIVRQGTFSIEKKEKNKVEKSNDNFLSDENIVMETDAKGLEPCISQVIMQIQNVLGGNQNINVVQNGLQQIVQPTFGATSLAANPTYIVVMGTPSVNHNDTTTCQETPDMKISNRTYRSQSFSAKEKPLTATRAAQNKADQLHQNLHQNQLSSSSSFQTPVRRPTLTRRSSFGSISRTKTVTESESSKKNFNAPETSSLVRRRSFQGALPNSVNTEKLQTDTSVATAISRRRSFHGPSTSSGIRPPSPQASQLKVKPIPANQMSSSGSNNDTIPARRKSLVNISSPKYSPQKMKTSYGIIKKPSAPPAARNLKIRVTQTLAGRSTAPLRAVIPMNRVAPLLRINEAVSPSDDKRSKSLITSTPRSLICPSPLALSKTSKGTGLPRACSTPSSATSTPSTPRKTFKKDTTFLSATPSTKIQAPKTDQSLASNLLRRRSMSDYRKDTSTEQSDNTSALNVKNTARSLLQAGLSKFTTKRMSSIGQKKPQILNLNHSKENKNPKL